MKVLKRENWWVWLFFTFITFGISNIFLAKCLDVVEDNKWYSDITNWVLGILLCIFPFFIMAVVFEPHTPINAARKLCVTGESIYTSPSSSSPSAQDSTRSSKRTPQNWI